MERIIELILKLSLLSAAVGSLLSLVRMTVAMFVPIYWYWWGAMAFFASTLFLSGALYVCGKVRWSAPATPDTSALG